MQFSKHIKSILVKSFNDKFHRVVSYIIMQFMTGDKKNATVWLNARKQEKRLHTDSWQRTPVFLACGYISSQDASLARERSRLTERPTGKCWRLAPVETQDYMRPYSTLCARVAVYLSPLGFSSMWLFFFCIATVDQQHTRRKSQSTVEKTTLTKHIFVLKS